MSDGASPWWLALAVAIVTGLCAAIAKLWADNIALRREAAERAELDAQRSERDRSEHSRDLRRMVWGPTDPPRGAPAPAPVIIRAKKRPPTP